MSPTPLPTMVSTPLALNATSGLGGQLVRASGVNLLPSDVGQPPGILATIIPRDRRHHLPQRAKAALGTKGPYRLMSRGTWSRGPTGREGGTGFRKGSKRRHEGQPPPASTRTKACCRCWLCHARPRDTHVAFSWALLAPGTRQRGPSGRRQGQGGRGRQATGGKEDNQRNFGFMSRGTWSRGPTERERGGTGFRKGSKRRHGGQPPPAPTRTKASFASARCAMLGHATSTWPSHGHCLHRELGQGGRAGGGRGKGAEAVEQRGPRRTTNATVDMHRGMLGMLAVPCTPARRAHGTSRARLACMHGCPMLLAADVGQRGGTGRGPGGRGTRAATVGVA